VRVTPSMIVSVEAYALLFQVWGFGSEGFCDCLIVFYSVYKQRGATQNF